MEKKYKVNEHLIKMLGYYDLVKKYSLFNDNLNEAAFLATTSLFTHLAIVKNKKDKNQKILVGDYLSFEYYDILQDDLKKLFLLSDAMKKNYLIISKKFLLDNEIQKEDLKKLSFNIPLVLLEFYDLKIREEDRVMLLSKFKRVFKKYL